MEEPRWRRYLRLWGRDPGADVDDELSVHLEERERLGLLQGLPPDDARREAERRFGDVNRIREECLVEMERQGRRAALGDSLRDAAGDVRLAFRSLGRSPVYAVTAALVLALAIGASTAVFSVVSAVLLRPLPYAQPERVVVVHNSWTGADRGGLSPAEYLDYAEQARGFSALGVYAITTANVVEGDVAERVPAALLTASTFEVLGVAPAAGRFHADDVAGEAAPAVVLSHEYWQARFGGDAAVVGRDMIVNGTSRTVIGVLPAGVRLPSTYGSDQPPALFTPLSITRASDPPRGSHFLRAVARLEDGWSAAAADADLKRVARELVTAYGDDYPERMQFSAYIVPVHEAVAGDTRRLLLMLTAAVGLVLLIACANVSSLVLTRTEDRRRELAVRTALGAGRWRIARQLLAEQLVVGAFAVAGGLALAVAGVRMLALLQPGDIPRMAEAAIDGRVLAFAILLGMATSLLVALAPLRLGGGAAATQPALREAGGRATSTRAAQRLRRGLIATEVALGVVLLAGAGLLLRSLVLLLAVDPGYRTDHVLTAAVALPAAGYGDNDAVRRFYAQLVDDVAALPGVQAAGAVINLPLQSSVGDLNITIEGREPAPGDMSLRLDWQVISPGWMEAMGIDIVRGRGLADADDARAPGVVVLSESAARRHWPDTDPIGQRFTLGGGAGPGVVTVIGIARDVRQAGLAAEPPAVMYLPHAQFTFWGGGATPSTMTLAVHAAGDPMSLAPAVRDVLRRLDPHVPLGPPRTMEQVVRAATAEPRFTASVLGAFAAVALLLTLVGIYGLVAYTVARRTREIAVRLALGAQPGRVVRQVVLQGMQPVLLGAVIGGVAALALGRTVQHMLYGITPRDPVTLAAALVLLPATALAACLLPARRAAAVAPQQVLREE